MSASPGKFVGNFSVNKGVEAKEYQFDPASGDGTKDKVDGDSRSDSASYVQVVVHKKRLPTASSPPNRSAPCNAPTYMSAVAPRTGSGDTEPSAVLLTCPALAALQRTWNTAEAKDIKNEDTRRVIEDQKLKKTRNKDCRLKPREPYFGEADRVEVYRFERSEELICAQRGIQRSNVEHWISYWAQPARALLDEVLGTLRVVITAPLNIVLQIERCAAESAWHVTGGAVTVLSDVLLKPALALGFNALVRPPLLCIRAIAEALRDAVRPAALLLGDVLEAAARPIAAIRLVHVQHCTCACHARPRHVASV